VTSSRSEQRLDDGHEALPVLGSVPPQSGAWDKEDAPIIENTGLVEILGITGEEHPPLAKL